MYKREEVWSVDSMDRLISLQREKTDRIWVVASFILPWYMQSYPCHENDKSIVLYRSYARA